MWIPRILNPEITKAAQSRPAVLLTGARQTGKSSLLEKIFEGCTRVTLDKLLLAQEAEENPSFFLDKFEKEKMVILDEIQYAPSLFRELKIRIDKNRTQYGKWILTGSQKFQLMENVSESLAGRIRILNLETLSAAELKAYPKIPEEKRRNYLWQGGYPELWSNEKLDFNSFFEDYVQTYLEKDLKKIINVPDLRDFRRLLMSCAIRTGQLINFTDLSKDLGVGINTVKKWLHALEAGGILYFLSPYYNNLGKRLTKASKFYFSDHGLLCYLLNVDNKTNWEKSPLKGALWENLVFCELLKNGRLIPGRNFFFYRDQNAIEVDFIIEIDNQIILIEAKAGENIDPRKLNFKKVAPLFKAKQVSCFAACMATEEKMIMLKDYGIFNPMEVNFFDFIQKN